MTLPIAGGRQQTVGGLSNLIGDLEGRVDRVQVSGQGDVATVTEECTNNCTNSCVTCDSCISCDSCTCTCVICGDPPTTTGPPTTGPTTIGPTTTLGPFGNGGWG